MGRLEISYFNELRFKKPKYLVFRNQIKKIINTYLFGKSGDNLSFI